MNNYLSQGSFIRFEGVRVKSINKINQLQSPGSVKKVFLNFIEAVEKELGIRLLVYSGQRSIEHQANLYQKYLEGGNIAAPPGGSWHNYGRAIDAVPVDGNGDPIWNTPKSTWKGIADIAKKYGLYSGYAFGDNPHHAYRQGTTIEQLKARQIDPGAPIDRPWLKPLLWGTFGTLAIFGIIRFIDRRNA